MILEVQNRSKKEKVDHNFLPGVVYAPDIETMMIKFKTNDFIKAYTEVGESSLLTLKLADQEFKVLVKDVQRDVIKDHFIHVDFYKVDMNKEVSTEIPLEFVGESKAVRELNAQLNKNIDFVSVECLPQDLVSVIEVDISALSEFGDSIHIKDLVLPSGIKVLNHPDDAVVSVTEPQIEKEPEVVEEGKTEEADDKVKEEEKKDEEKKD
ncbi:MAG TPA: 50S ribosomal protein L25 [Patescibacteria group bacterium]|nr:50S ribosomal protein L25 [Patescibacteria group bacterium]